MVLKKIRASWSSRRRYRQSTVVSNDIPFVRYEETAEAEQPSKLNRVRSLREILLPQLPRHKPMSIGNFLSIGTTAPAKTSIATQNVQSTVLSPVQEVNTLPTISEDMLALQKRLSSMVITRKPVAQSSKDPRPQPYTPSFNPQAPRVDASLHLKAKAVLMARYQSKFTHEYEVHEGVDIRKYDFIWVQGGELEKKVLDDIVWVRERFAFARRSEPTDDQIIFWYDGEKFAKQFDAEVDQQMSGMLVKHAEDEKIVNVEMKVTVEEVIDGEKVHAEKIEKVTGGEMEHGEKVITRKKVKAEKDSDGKKVNTDIVTNGEKVEVKNVANGKNVTVEKGVEARKKELAKKVESGKKMDPKLRLAVEKRNSAKKEAEKKQAEETSEVHKEKTVYEEAPIDKYW